MKLTYCSERNNQVLLLNDELVNSTFCSNTRQLFDVNGDCYIYYTDEQKLHKVSFDSYILLLLKLNKLEENERKTQFSRV